jgi:alpha-glucosidase (family GH31 glycosyl hydrolase)
VPFGESILSTKQAQKVAKVRVYPGADAELTLYDDDGTSYAYEKGDSRVTKLRWDDRAGRLSFEGTPAWTGSLDALVDVVGR